MGSVIGTIEFVSQARQHNRLLLNELISDFWFWVFCILFISRDFPWSFELFIWSTSWIRTKASCSSKTKFSSSKFLRWQQIEVTSKYRIVLTFLDILLSSLMEWCWIYHYAWFHCAEPLIGIWTTPSGRAGCDWSLKKRNAFWNWKTKRLESFSPNAPSTNILALLSNQFQILPVISSWESRMTMVRKAHYQRSSMWGVPIVYVAHLISILSNNNIQTSDLWLEQVSEFHYDHVLHFNDL